ncbi:MAG: 50S ribosomal protein L32 [candidate division Zixibacteria bacterium]|nr:50S ribosomal protein L32 [Candidatus Tariuqbacter arcticus]
MAVPKRKTSRSKKNKRRSHHALTMPSYSRCSNCGHLILPHRTCPNCGYYHGRSVFIPTQS